MPDDVRVSLLMANYNGGPFVEASLRSALAQTLGAIEVIVADDASTDGSAEIAEAVARTDGRVRVLRAPTNTGISATRNRAIAAARGEWLAVQDSDDLMHPGRLARLVAIGERDGADLVADDLLEFPSDGDGAHKLLVGARRPFPIGAPRLLRQAHVLGYLKPIWRRRTMGALRYDVDMLVAEDFDLAIRMVVAGARYRFHPEALYFYRKHHRSISAGSDRRKQSSILAGDDRFRADHALTGPSAAAAEARRRKIERHMSYDEAVDALKRRDLGGALRAVAARPSSALVFQLPLRVRLERAARRALRRPVATVGDAPALLCLATAAASFARPDPAALAAAARRAGLAVRGLLLGAAAVGVSEGTPFDAFATAPAPRNGSGEAAEPSRQALAVARHARSIRLVVSLDADADRFLPYRLDQAIPAFTAASIGAAAASLAGSERAGVSA